MVWGLGMGYDKGRWDVFGEGVGEGVGDAEG